MNLVAVVSPASVWEREEGCRPPGSGHWVSILFFHHTYKYRVFGTTSARGRISPRRTAFVVRAVAWHPWAIYGLSLLTISFQADLIAAPPRYQVGAGLSI